MKISIIGTGYVGLITGLCLAETSHEVTCIDNDQSKIERINKGECIIHEEGLKNLLDKNLGKNFKASTDLEAAVQNTDVSIIAVGTPFSNGAIDLSFIESVSKDIGIALSKKNDFHLIVVKSTVVPGTTDDVVLPILENFSNKKAGIDFGLGMNPEFLREGSAIFDFMNPDRIVMGSIDEKSDEYLKKIYQSFNNVTKISTNNKTAEMIKYANNSLLATLISFSNEIGNVCSTQGEIDIKDVLKGVHLDNRISPLIDNKRIEPGIVSYLNAGCGFGGSCFPKDVQALISYGESKNSEMKLLKSVVEINKLQPFKIIEIIKKHFDSVKNVNISILGVAFKPGTDDMRESPAIPIIRELSKMSAKLSVYDPVAENEAKQIFSDIKINFSKSLASIIKSAQIVILITSWPEFNSLDELISNNYNDPLVIDGRRVLDKSKFKKYEGIGYSS